MRLIPSGVETPFCPPIPPSPPPSPSNGLIAGLYCKFRSPFKGEEAIRLERSWIIPLDCCSITTGVAATNHERNASTSATLPSSSAGRSARSASSGEIHFADSSQHEIHNWRWNAFLYNQYHPHLTSPSNGLIAGSD